MLYRSTSSSVILGVALQSKAICLCARRVPPGSALFLVLLGKKILQITKVKLTPPSISHSLWVFLSAPNILCSFTDLSGHSHPWEVTPRVTFQWELADVFPLLTHPSQDLLLQTSPCVHMDEAPGSTNLSPSVFPCCSAELISPGAVRAQQRMFEPTFPCELQSESTPSGAGDFRKQQCHYCGDSSSSRAPTWTCPSAAVSIKNEQDSAYWQKGKSRWVCQARRHKAQWCDCSLQLLGHCQGYCWELCTNKLQALAVVAVSWPHSSSRGASQPCRASVCSSQILSQGSLLIIQIIVKHC